MIGKIMVKLKIVDCRDTLDTEGTTQEPSFPRPPPPSDDTRYRYSSSNNSTFFPLWQYIVIVCGTFVYPSLAEHVVHQAM
jgi:hypothetical protein